MEFFLGRGIKLPEGSFLIAWEKEVSATIFVPFLNSEELEKLLNLIFTSVQSVENQAVARADLDIDIYKI